MKYYAIGLATLMIVGVTGFSTAETEVPAEQEVNTQNIDKDVQKVEYIEFDPYYITAKSGKNEG